MSRGAILGPGELLKSIVYRTPILSRLMAPAYPYKINPAQLLAMVNLIDATRSSGAAIAEIGVAQGDTSVFLLEHLASVDDPRTLLLFDTFSGFTPESIAVEVNERHKDVRHYDKFRYGDEQRFCRNIERAGYRNFRTIKGDAVLVDWAAIGPIGAVLLDIDLYKPTLAVLEAVYDQLVPGGGIVIDDCRANSPWDGALQAYVEFIDRRGLPFTRIGRKGAMIRRHTGASPLSVIGRPAATK